MAFKSSQPQLAGKGLVWARSSNAMTPSAQISVALSAGMVWADASSAAKISGAAYSGLKESLRSVPALPVIEMMVVLLSQCGREAGHLGVKDHRSRGPGYSGLRPREVGKAETRDASSVVLHGTTDIELLTAYTLLVLAWNTQVTHRNMHGTNRNTQVTHRKTVD
jgi:hypothetical protein